MKEAERVIYPGQIYRHFKGNLYQIVTVAIHSESGEKLVIYQKLYGDYAVHARPYDMFLSEVDKDKYPDVKQRYRFELVDKDIKNNGCIRSDNEIKTDKDQASYKNIKVDNDIDKERISGENKKSDIDIKTDRDIVSDEDINTNREPELEAEISENVPENEESADKRLIAFLDAETFEEKRRVLIDIKDGITDRLIDDMAAAIDVTVDEGDIDTRFMSLLNCINTRAKYEVNRFR